MLRRTLNVYVPDELAERARSRGLNVSALTQTVIAGELERASLSMAQESCGNPGSTLLGSSMV